MPMGKEFQSSSGAMGFGYNPPSVSYGSRPLSSNAAKRWDEMDRERLDIVRTEQQREYQTAYQDILGQYNKYSGREDDQSKILRAYYLELLNDLNDPKKMNQVIRRWATGYITGIGPKRGSIASQPIDFRRTKPTKEEK